MPLNGSGSYIPPAPEFPAIPNTIIYASDFNQIILDIASALSLAIFRDYWPDEPSDDPLSPDGETQVYYQTKVILRTIETRTREVGRKSPRRAGASAGGGLGFEINGQAGGRAFGIFAIGADLTLDFDGPNSGGGGRNGGQGKAVPGANISGGGHLMRRTERITPLTLGDSSDNFDVTDRTVTEVYRITNPPTAASTGGSGQGSPAGGSGEGTRTRDRSK